MQISMQQKLEWHLNLTSNERIVHLRPQNLLRAINNLIENADYHAYKINISII